MRVTLLGIVFLLLLTLGNAFWMRHDRAFVAAHDYAPVQLVKSRATHYEWDAFLWREIAAVVLTMVLFGGYQAFAGSSTHER